LEDAVLSLSERVQFLTAKLKDTKKELAVQFDAKTWANTESDGKALVIIEGKTVFSTSTVLVASGHVRGGGEASVWITVDEVPTRVFIDSSYHSQPVSAAMRGGVVAWNCSYTPTVAPMHVHGVVNNQPGEHVVRVAVCGGGKAATFNGFRLVVSNH